MKHFTRLVPYRKRVVKVTKNKKQKLEEEQLTQQELASQDNIESIDSATQETEQVDDGATQDAGQDAQDVKEPQENEYKAKADEYHDLLLRTRAEFENYRKRTLRESAQKMKYANENLLMDILQVVDNFERALMSAQSLEENCKEQGEVVGFVQGIRLTYKQLLDFLSRNGVERIQTQDAGFDPHFHEAVDFVETDEVEEDMIVACLQTGYMIADRVLRPACVRVAKQPAAAAKDQTQEQDQEPETAESNG